MKRTFATIALVTLGSGAFAADSPPPIAQATNTDLSRPGPVCEASNDEQAKACDVGATLVLSDASSSKFSKNTANTVATYCDLRYNFILLNILASHPVVCVKK